MTNFVTRLLCLLFLQLFMLPADLWSQQQFDILTYTSPRDWKIETSASALQFTKENKADGSYCIVTIFKSMPSPASPAQNFEATWTTLVKEMVHITEKPSMQPTVTENGWEAVSGYAGFEADGQKGVAMLISSTGHGKLVNIIILTNSNQYNEEMTALLGSVKLPVMAETKPASQQVTADQPSKKTNTGFTFNHTNFDDGWVSTIGDSWVEVKKAGIRVLIHYPQEQTDKHYFNKQEGDLNAWNTLVAPRYSQAGNVLDRGIQDYQSICFLTNTAVDRQTGKRVYIVLFKKHYDKGHGRYMEVVADSQQQFEKEFGNNYINRSSWEYMEQIKSWDKLANMQWRNKFAVSYTDLIGKWSSSTYASLSYYYVNGGGFAGATATSIADEFNFYAGNKYMSDHAGASGTTGNQKFSRQVYKGVANVSDWNMNLSNRFQGATDKFDCYFEAIKGGRILQLTDRLGTTISLVKSK